MSFDIFAPLESSGFLLERTRLALVGTPYEGILVTSEVPRNPSEKLPFVVINVEEKTTVSQGYQIVFTGVTVAAKDLEEAETTALWVCAAISDEDRFLHPPIFRVEADSPTESLVLADGKIPTFVFSASFFELATTI